jgi:hypothetical protein
MTDQVKGMLLMPLTTEIISAHYQHTAANNQVLSLNY